MFGSSSFHASSIIVHYDGLTSSTKVHYVVKRVTVMDAVVAKQIPPVSRLRGFPDSARPAIAIGSCPLKVG